MAVDRAAGFGRGRRRHRLGVPFALAALAGRDTFQGHRPNRQAWGRKSWRRQTRQRQSRLGRRQTRCQRGGRWPRQAHPDQHRAAEFSRSCRPDHGNREGSEDETDRHWFQRLREMSFRRGDAQRKAKQRQQRYRQNSEARLTASRSINVNP